VGLGTVCGGRVVDVVLVDVDVVDEEVVVDDNLVTSRQPDDIPAFVERSLQLLQAGAEQHADA
jgi:deglycase